MKRKLTAKQAAFCSEYLVDLNAAQAAIRAGYSKNCARMMGYENLTKPYIRAVILKGKRDRAERVEVDADWVLQRLAMEAEADIADLYDPDGSLKSVHDWPMIWRQGLVSGIDTLAGNITKIKISDRIKRIELIGKHIDVSAFMERHQVSVSKTLEGATDAELLREYEKQRSASNNKRIH